MKKGFTLIELLAVIVILAIIALIATPIVLNIINDTKESALARSAEFYLDAVEYSISMRILSGKTIEDGVYTILESGNICLGTLEDNTCKGEILEVKIDGKVPNGEKITIKDGMIVSHIIKYGDAIVKSETSGAEETPVQVGSATFSDGTTLAWEELKLEENGTKYAYIASTISDTEIGGGAFSNNSKLTNVDLYGCDKLTTIGPSAFADCFYLKSITLPDSLTTIDNSAFSWCYSLESIAFEGTVAQWNAISKGADWNEKVPATYVQCSDGTVSLS